MLYAHGMCACARHAHSQSVHDHVLLHTRGPFLHMKVGLQVVVAVIECLSAADEQMHLLQEWQLARILRKARFRVSCCAPLLRAPSQPGITTTGYHHDFRCYCHRPHASRSGSALAPASP